MNRSLFLLACCVAAAYGVPADAGLYKTITIDNDYSDWADVPALDSDPLDNPGFVDFAVTKVVNDGDFLYVYNSFHTAQSLGAFTALDVDSDAATGFDIFGLGLVGSEAGWQNDFPFTQDAANFNNGSGMSGDFFGSGAALIGAFSDGFERELAFSLNTTFNSDSSPVFADDDFTLLFWTDQGSSDVTAAINYQLATIPEPCSLLLFGPGLLALVGRRR